MSWTALCFEVGINKKNTKAVWPEGVQSVLCNPRQGASNFVYWLWNGFRYSKEHSSVPQTSSIMDDREGISISMLVSRVFAPNCHLHWHSSVAELPLSSLIFKLCDYISCVSAWFLCNPFSLGLMWRWQAWQFSWYLCLFWTILLNKMLFPYVSLWISRTICTVDALLVFQRSQAMFVMKFFLIYEGCFIFL